MAEFPTLVYQVPGPHRLTGDKGYDYQSVADAEALEAALESGWFESLAEAIEGRREQVRTTEGPTEERKALEAEAKSLGVKFNWRTDDEALVERILAAKEAPAPTAEPVKEEPDGE